MATIPLTQGKVAIVDDEDLERCLAYKWYANKKANRPQSWYAMRPDPQKRGGKIYLHRFLLGVPKGVKVDHRDGNPLNCRRFNLRSATTTQNGANRIKQQKRSTSQYKGVSRERPNNKWRNPKWRATIVVNKKAIALGFFHSERAAARAYDHAALKHFGPFARTNFAVHSAQPKSA